MEDRYANTFSYTEDTAGWNRREKEIEENLRLDLTEEYGLTGHHKAQAVWSLAWETGKSCGIEEIRHWFGVLAFLVIGEE